MRSWITRLHAAQSGQTMTEYAAVLSVLVVAVAATLGLLDESIRTSIESLVGHL